MSDGTILHLCQQAFPGLKWTGDSQVARATCIRGRRLTLEVDGIGVALYGEDNREYAHTEHDCTVTNIRRAAFRSLAVARRNLKRESERLEAAGQSLRDARRRQ